jgi:hypothetical protein
MNAFAPDANFIGSGPFRYKSFTTSSSLVMVANTAGSTVKTDRSGSVPITSTKGYHNYCPVYVDVHTVNLNTGQPDYTAKINILSTTQKWNLVNLDVTLLNKWLNSSSVFSNLNANKTVRVDGTPIVNNLPEVLTPGVPVVEHLTNLNLTVGMHTVTVTAVVTGPATVDPWHVNPWIGQVITVTLRLYITRQEDIAGSTFYDDISYTTGYYANATNRNAVPTPDMVVDGTDLSTAAKAFGSYAGSGRWNSICDVNHDYVVDGSDLAIIALRFGWPPA